MSNEFPIQTTSLDELAAGQRPLTPPAGDRRGNEHASQVFPLSGRTGVNVESSSGQQSPVAPNVAAGAGSRPKESVSGMSVTGRAQENAPRVDQVDVSDGGRHKVAGSVGDVAKGSLHQAAEGQGGPRSSRGQFPNGRADTAGKGGSFGNQHANQSYPSTVDNGD